MFNRSARLLCALALLFPIVASAQPAGPRVPPGLDGRLMAIARQVPGFGGYFFDANGDLNVYLTDLTREPAARAAVAQAARNRPERPARPWSGPAQIITRHGDYDFVQLEEWRGRVTAAVAHAGVQVVDTDEAKNRIFVGVTDQQSRSRVLTLIDGAGVPRNAVTVEIVPKLVLAASLRDDVRPLVGGLEIGYNNNGTPTVCTLGVNVWYTNLAAGVPTGTAGFYTAAHCSTTRFGTDGTVFSQGEARIGYEMWDPPTFTSAWDSRCAPNWLCRWSDVAFAAYDPGYNRHQGAIAQTLYRGWGTDPSNPNRIGSIDINSGSPEFTLYQTALPVQGGYMDKVGRTTGWTSGPVVRTCADYFFGGDILCQDEVEAWADGGDSGGPVFQWTGQTTAAFAGIVWARNDPTGGLGHFNFVFSNIDRIAADMGNSVTYGPN
jgi:hypothetical protein